MYLALPVSSGRFLPAIRVRKYSRTVIKKIYVFRLPDYHGLWCWFPTTSSIHTFCNFPRNKTKLLSYNPSVLLHRFGLFPFRSPLLRECRWLTSTFFYFPPGTEMFHFPGCAPRQLMCQDYWGLLNRVSPFRNLRIKGYRHLPEAYRRLITSFIAC